MPQIFSQFPATYSLSNLDGQNGVGVKFTGENANDDSGLSVIQRGT